MAINFGVGNFSGTRMGVGVGTPGGIGAGEWLTPIYPFDIQYLVVAGGGGGAGSSGGGYVGGGGGAGGFRTGTLTASGPTSYSIVVGAGGAGSDYNSGFNTSGDGGAGSPGSNSTFYTTTSTGGGGGGRANQSPTFGPGLPGGSGGGSGSYYGGPGTSPVYGPIIFSTPISAGAGIPGQGNPGGYTCFANRDTGSYNGQAFGGGSGGGAGSPGVSATSCGGQPGGAGLPNPIIGSTVGELATGTYYLAGGGAGTGYYRIGNLNGVGGLGGGGGYAPGKNGTGLQSSGGGGGAGQYPVAGKSGGSGVVILKVPTSSYLRGMNATSSTVSTIGDYTILTYTASSILYTVSLPIIPRSPYNANYIVVAGGGGGGSPNGPSWNVATGRGGAGGVLQGCVTLTIGTTYTVSVGGGGGSGTNGNPSTFSAVPTVAVGGGAGGRAGMNVPGGPGFPGGSGGGGGAYYPGGLGTALPAGTGTPGQGYPGGGIFGGGAGGAGTPTGAGAGYAWPVTGSTYGSGGCGTPSIAGKGGGGCGGTAQDGMVIIAVPNAGYSGTYSPSPAITISTCGPGYPGKTLITFNGSGNYTA